MFRVKATCLSKNFGILPTKCKTILLEAVDEWEIQKTILIHLWKIMNNKTPWLEISGITAHYLWLAFFHIGHSIHPFSPNKNLYTHKNMGEFPSFCNEQKLHQKYSRNQHLHQFMRRTASFTCMKLSIVMILWHHTNNNMDTSERNKKPTEVHGINSAQD